MLQIFVKYSTSVQVTFRSMQNNNITGIKSILCSFRFDGDKWYSGARQVQSGREMDNKYIYNIRLYVNSDKQVTVLNVAVISDKFNVERKRCFLSKLNKFSKTNEIKQVSNNNSTNL
jgi:hypothetical protein